MNHVNIRLLLAKIPYLSGVPHQLAASLVWNGQSGVQIFFAVSGFLITSISLRRWGSLSHIAVRDFYILRFARIAPLLLSLLAVLSILHAARLQDYVISPAKGGLGQTLFAALTFHVNILEAHRGYLPANWDILWSLSVEEMFYLFFPLTCRLAAREKILVVILIVFVALGPLGRTVFAQGNEIAREYSYLGGMDSIALGCLTALFTTRHRLSKQTLRILAALGAALLIFSLCFSIRANTWGLARSGLNMTVLGLGTCMVIAASAQTRWRCPRLLSPVLLLGRRSYEVYLTHMFVVFGLLHLFLRTGKSIPAILLFFFAAIALSGLLGELVARFYSDPMNRWLRSYWADQPQLLDSVIEPVRATIS